MLEVVGIGERDAVEGHVELPVDESSQALILGRIETGSVRGRAHEARREIGDRAVVPDRRDDLLNGLAAYGRLRRSGVGQRLARQRGFLAGGHPNVGEHPGHDLTRLVRARDPADRRHAEYGE